MSGNRSTFLATVLSVLAPGSGHLYLGRRPRGLALLLVTFAVWAGIGVSLAGPVALRSNLSAILLLVPYVLLIVPSVREVRSSDIETTAIDRPAYVLVMLAVFGPLALPLLWQSRAFGRGGKIAWTIVVAAVVVVAVYAIVVAGPMIEDLLQQASGR